MPKSDLTVRVKVTSVTVKKDATFESYKKGGKNASDFKEVAKGVQKADAWTATVEVDHKKEKVKKVNGVGYPVVDGHPGHVDPGTKGWKYNIERGNQTVDRLFVKATATVSSEAVTEVKKGRITIRYLDVECAVKATLSVAEDTH